MSAHPAQPATPTSPAKPAINVGDIVSKGGIPIVYTTLRVFCIYYTDEFGEKAYPRGESPQEVGQRAFNAYCIPINENGQPQTINDPAKTEPAETVPGAPTASVPPAPQPQPAF